MKKKIEKDFTLYDKIKKGISDFLYDASVDLHEITHSDKKKKDALSLSAAELKKQKSTRRRRELFCIWSVLILPLIDLIIFWVAGTVLSIPIAFEHYTADGAVEYSFYNFEYLFRSITEPNSIFLEALLNSLKYWAFSFFILTPVSFIMGFFLYKKVWGYRIFRYVFFFPSIISSVIIAAFFKYMVGPGGPVQQLAEILFGQKDILLLADSRYAFPTMLFYNFYTGLTGNLLYWLASFSRIPVDVTEAGRLDGLSIMGEFRYITFPITWPFLATMLMLMFTGILTGSGAALLLTGGAYGTYDLGYYEYLLTVSGTKNDQGIAGAVGLLKGVIVLPLALIINRLVNKIEPVEF